MIAVAEGDCAIIVWFKPVDRKSHGRRPCMADVCLRKGDRWALVEVLIELNGSGRLKVVS